MKTGWTCFLAMVLLIAFTLSVKHVQAKKGKKNQDPEMTSLSSDNKQEDHVSQGLPANLQIHRFDIHRLQYIGSRGGVASQQADCQAGQVAISGGYEIIDRSPQEYSYETTEAMLNTATSYTVAIRNRSLVDKLVALHVYVICVEKTD